MAVFASAFAQTNRDWNNRNNDPYWNAKTNNNVYQNDRDHDRDDRRYNQNNNYSIAERNQMIQRINNDFNYRIQQVNNNRSISRRERKRVIEDLEAQKAQAISNVYARSSNANVYRNDA